MKIVATLTDRPQKFTASHRKDRHFSQSWLFVSQDTAEIRCNVYETSGRSYCCLWINLGGQIRSGTGYAGGCGYHRSSAAVQEAITNAGIHLSEPIDGRGEHAIESALVAIAAAAGMVGRVVHVHP